MKTFQFRFEYSVEAETLEAATAQVASDIEENPTFRSAVADVYVDEKHVGTIDFEKIES